MLLQRLTQEPLGRGQVEALTEPEPHRAAVVLNSAVEIPSTSITLADMRNRASAADVSS